MLDEERFLTEYLLMRQIVINQIIPNQLYYSFLFSINKKKEEKRSSRFWLVFFVFVYFGFARETR